MASEFAPASPSGRHRSFWLQQIAGDASDAPPLRGASRADVVIVGGGYVGLWTAIRIKEQDPSCDVIVLEQDIAGGGASGRNGGFVLSWWPKLVSLARLYGPREAVAIARNSEAAIDEIRSFTERHGIDADFRRGGWLWTATTDAQLDAWKSVLDVCDQMGIQVFDRWASDEVARRAGSSVHRAGVFEASAAIVQPARLVRGLRRVALGLGVRLFENTRVVRFSRSRPVQVKTAEGSVVADRLVLAMNAWAAGVPELSRGLAVISSDIIVTAPIADRLEEIGWNPNLSITDSQTMVDYYRVSREGRVMFGKGGWTIGYGGRIGPRFDRHPGRAALVTADFHRYYPKLRDVPITHDWSGPIDRTVDSLPLLGYLGGREHIVYGVGWSGNGVGPSVIGGRILASLALGLVDEWSQHPLVGRPTTGFPSEPIRFIGAHLVRGAVMRKEMAEAAGRAPSRLAVALAKLAPAGLEDKK